MTECKGQTRWLVRGSLTAAILLCGLLWMALSAGTPASAEPEFLPGFSQTYPEASASALNGCLLCHTSPSPSDEDDGRNPYGDDWEERGDKNYLAIDNLDSDRDGFSNRVEIQALSFPGDPSSTPLTVTTRTTLPGTPPDGQALYAASCAACHGTGGGNLVNTSLSESQFINVVAGGRGASMPAFGGSLSTADIAAIFSYVTGAPPPTTTSTAPGTPPQPIDAASLFNSTCSGCHGPNGGNLVPTSLTSGQLASVITDGRAAMPGYGSSLSGEQIQALATYLINQSTSPAPATTTTAPGTRSRAGAAVWASDCAGCHGPAGGNVAGTTLSRSQLVSVISNGTGSMPSFENRIPAEEIAAVADYLRATAETTTTTAPDTEPVGADLYMQNCAVCHGPHGEGGSGGAIAGSGLSPGEIELLITDGTGSMAGFGAKLGTADITALVDHVAGIAGSESSESAADGTNGDDGDSLVGGSDSTSTRQTITDSGGADGDVTASQVATLSQVSLPEPERRESAGSPWLPVLGLVAVVSWLVFDAVKSGQLPSFTRRRPARPS